MRAAWSKEVEFVIVIETGHEVLLIFSSGLGAIAAAVMSSTDSAILGSSAMFTHNVYRKIRPKVKLR